MTLKNHTAKLRAPFTPEAVKWRLDQKQPNAAGKARCLVFLDARLAAERLTEVDPDWTTEYTFIAGTQQDALGLGQYAPTACALTLHGVTRTGVGQLGSTKADSKHAKSVVSDAFKRAGVEFGVGAFLYALPVFMVSVAPHGKPTTGAFWGKAKSYDGKTWEDVLKGLTPAGVKELREAYAKVVYHPKFQERWGEPIDYGYVADDERSATPELSEPAREELAPRARARTRGAS